MQLMKVKLLLFTLSLLPFLGFSQTWQQINYKLGYQYKGVKIDSGFILPKIQAYGGWRDTGSIYYRLADSSIHVWTGSQWRQVGGTTLDTTSLSNRINLKLNISDTASMLSPYLRSNVAAATYQPIGSYATTSQVSAVQSNLDTTRNGIRADLNGKQSTLVSGTNIKTVNGNSLLGSGDLTISGGGGSADSVVTYISGSTYAVPNAVNIVYINPSTTTASLTITLPATPHSSKEIEIYFGGTITSGTVITAITISPNSGQSILQVSAPSLLEAGESISYKYNSSNSKWYRK